MKKLIILFLFAASIMFTHAATYDNMLQKMQALAEKYPSYIQMFDIGTNDQGNLIYGMRIENPNYQTEDKKIPQLLVGCHHGNEQLSADVCIVFANQLMACFQDSDHKLHKALSRSVFYVIPVLNITGYNAYRREESHPSYGTLDPNRDYEDPCVANSFGRLASTSNLAHFVERYQIVGAVTAHGYIGTFTYPWGIYTKKTATEDHSAYKEMGNLSIAENGYRTGTHSDVIYPASGAFEDWSYNKHGIWTMLLEHRRSADLEKDSKAVLVFFSRVPSKRSTKHQHDRKNCTRDSETRDMKGRP